MNALNITDGIKLSAKSLWSKDATGALSANYYDVAGTFRYELSLLAFPDFEKDAYEESKSTCTGVAIDGPCYHVPYLDEIIITVVMSFA